MSSTAVEALVAKLTIISSDTVTNGESLDVLWHVSLIEKATLLTHLSDSSDHTNGLMTRNQRELGDKFTLMNVLVNPLAFWRISARRYKYQVYSGQ